ncbi:TauD/TfdA family dioxygenase [Kitasatospora sp. MAP5-34]|uniref:TauD/TfdA family dioxygenase n=1 Tax=Kitasatospora sp. MAP5-34 TaxID=3035102 RepID=UPI002476E150|nr:TauD/TfdA family dioxygenase [Kitasatospora sp. MAP5-34]MDH6579390.1 hypothetical protein [Kitasatospora sp. MAP5-34]
MSLSSVGADFFVPWGAGSNAALVDARIGVALRERGAAGLVGLRSRADVLAAAHLLMPALRAHRDSDPDGLTVIRDTGQHAHRPGFAGLGHGALLAHTEGTQAPDPPRLILLACLHCGQAGGATVLVDDRAVLGELASLQPAAVTALMAPRAAYFGGAAGRLAPVLERLPTERWRIQLRQDGLAKFSPAVQPYLPALRAVIRRNTATLRLEPGQAVILDNHRVLHGRSSFTGDRLLLRALGEPCPALQLEAGFAPPPDLLSSAGSEAEAARL